MKFYLQKHGLSFFRKKCIMYARENEKLKGKIRWLEIKVHRMENPK